MVHVIKTKTKRFVKWMQGFSAVEYLFAALLLAILFVNVGKVLVSAITNGQLVQKVTDTTDLTLQKTTELFNDAKNQSAKIPDGQTEIGSIDPTQPVNGYFDLFNESGCLLTTSKIRIEGGSGGTTGAGKVDPPTDTGGTKGLQADPGSELAPIDCSTANYTKPSRSLVPKFRRQWFVKKDFPNPKDVTFAVIVVYTSNNTVVRSNIVTKSDGIATQ